jgi:hypothetical protein
LFLPRLAATKRLRKYNRKTQRGYLWIGPQVDFEDLPLQHVIAYTPEVLPTRRRR